MIVCPECVHTVNISSGFISEFDQSFEDVPNCKLCKGEGNITMRYYVEYYFMHIDRKYWLPIFFECNNYESAILIAKRFEIELKSKYDLIRATQPILYDSASFIMINGLMNQFRGKRSTHISVLTWKFQKELKKELSMMDNILEMTEELFTGRKSIAKQVGNQKFPIKVISENPLTTNYPDLLVVEIGV